MRAIRQYLLDPKYQKQFGDPPSWFFDCYDAIILGIPLYNAQSIREVPLYIRYRVRVVHEIMQEVRMKLANKGGAMGVFDYSSLFA